MSAGMPAEIRLHQWAAIVTDYFGHTCYHVGSSLFGKDWRDVDVRLLLPDDEFAAMFGERHRDALANRKLAAVTLAFATLGREMTGLPIDFQIQPMTYANEKFGLKPRGALITYRAAAPAEEADRDA